MHDTIVRLHCTHYRGAWRQCRPEYCIMVLILIVLHSIKFSVDISYKSHEIAKSAFTHCIYIVL